MRSLICFFALFIGFLHYSSSVTAAHPKEVRAFSDFADDVVWKKFEGYIEPELIKGVPEPTINSDILFDLMEKTARAQSATAEEGERLFDLVRPELRKADKYSEYAKFWNDHIGDTITLVEVRRLATLKDGNEGIFFALDPDYVDGISTKSKSVENEVSAKLEMVAETEKNIPVLPGVKPKVPVMMSDVDTVAGRLAAIPSMQADISVLWKKFDEVNIGGTDVSVSKTDINVLSEKVDGLIVDQKRLSDEQVVLAKNQLETLKHVENQPLVPSTSLKTQGGVSKELIKESVVEMLSGRQLVSKYPYLTAFIVIFTMLLILWFITKPIFWLLKNKSERKWREETKEEIKESVSKDVNDNITELKNNHIALETIVTDVQAGLSNLTDEIYQVQTSQRLLRDEVEQVHNRVNERVAQTELLSSLEVQGLEELNSLRHGKSVKVMISSTLDDTPSYEVIFKNKDERNFEAYGVWRDEDKKGEPIVVYPKNTNFIKTLKKAYIKNRLEIVSDDEEIKVA